MRLIWTARAQEHVAALHRYIAGHDPEAADRVAGRIVDLAQTILTAHPESGRAGRVSGTRELVVTGTPYIVAYQAADEAIVVLAVLH